MTDKRLEKRTNRHKTRFPVGKKETRDTRGRETARGTTVIKQK